MEKRSHATWQTGISFFFLSALLLLLLNVDVPAVAQNYPNRLVRIVVPFPAGGGLDIIARAVAQGLSATLGQAVAVDNHSGADGMIGTDQVAKAVPDGYTLLMSSTGPMVINPALNSKMPYDTLRDFAAEMFISLTARGH